MVQPTSEISIPKTGKGIQPYSQETVKRQFCLKENIEGSDFLVSGFPSDPQMVVSKNMTLTCVESKASNKTILSPEAT